MKIIERGHIYQLEHRDGSGAGLLVFVNREAGTEHEGTQTQEVLRALIDRTQHCDSCLRWEGNDKIVEHLRMALAAVSDHRTVSTSLGLVHNVTTAAWHGGGFVTTCKRSCVKTPLDDPPRVVTCVWCVAGRPKARSPRSQIHVSRSRSTTI